MHWKLTNSVRFGWNLFSFIVWLIDTKVIAVLRAVVSEIISNDKIISNYNLNV